MTSFANTIAEHRRISILRLLADCDGRANESILTDALEQMGLDAGLTRSVVRDDLRFLEGAGTVRLQWFGDTLAVAHILERGVDAARGRIVIDGVRKPSVGE